MSGDAVFERDDGVPFDPSKPFETRDGRAVLNFRSPYPHRDSTHPLRGEVSGRREMWGIDGRWAVFLTNHPLDLVNRSRRIENPPATISVPLPTFVGLNTTNGMITLEYAFTPQNKEMARRVAEAMLSRDDRPG